LYGIIRSSTPEKRWSRGSSPAYEMWWTSLMPAMEAARDLGATTLEKLTRVALVPAMPPLDSRALNMST
jgi:hypothetical protein